MRADGRVESEGVLTIKGINGHCYREIPSVRAAPVAEEGTWNEAFDDLLPRGLDVRSVCYITLNERRGLSRQAFKSQAEQSDRGFRFASNTWLVPESSATILAKSRRKRLWGERGDPIARTWFSRGKWQGVIEFLGYGIIEPFAERRLFALVAQRREHLLAE